MSDPDILVYLNQMVFRSQAWERDDVEHMIRKIVTEREAHDSVIAKMRDQRDAALAEAAAHKAEVEKYRALLARTVYVINRQPDPALNADLLRQIKAALAATPTAKEV